MIFLLICLEAQPSIAQSDSCHLQISLLTCGPGEDLYSIWGHTAIRVKNTSTHLDEVYNYGTFDDSDPYFYVKFTRGIMLYSLSVEPFTSFMDEYVYERRSVKEQILRLTCAEKEKLLAALKANADEKSRYYAYHFYNDNCTLRARDIIVNNSGSPVTFKNILPNPNATFRNHINAYLDRSGKYWNKFGINILLASHLDAVMTNQQSMFLPDYLMQGFENASAKNGPLVETTREILGGNNSDTGNSSWFTPGFLFTALLIVTLGLTFLKLPWSKTVMQSFDIIFFFSIGLIGILMWFLWLGRVDTVCRNNFNVMWAWPTHAVIIFFSKKKNWVRNYFRVAGLVSIIFLLVWKWWPQEFPFALIPLLLLIIFRCISISQKNK